MGYSSRGNLRPQFARAKEDWNMLPDVMSQFLLQYLDGRLRIWHLQHESINPFCLVSTFQATTAGVTWLVSLKCHRLSVVADHVPLFMAKMYPSTNGYFQQDNASTATRSLSKRHFRMWWNTTFTSWMYCRQTSTDWAISCQYGPKSLIFPAPSWIYTIKNWGNSQSRRVSNWYQQFIHNKVYISIVRDCEPMCQNKKQDHTGHLHFNLTGLLQCWILLKSNSLTVRGLECLTCDHKIPSSLHHSRTKIPLLEITCL